jgi:hypothetical protein
VSFQAIETYVIDAFTLHAASGTTIFSVFSLGTHFNTLFYIAIGAATCLRSLAGFGFPLFAPAMFNKLGYGKGNTILACLAVILGCPAYVHLIYLIC